jgi:hypothetical protein
MAELRLACNFVEKFQKLWKHYQPWRAALPEPRIPSPGPPVTSLVHNTPNPFVSENGPGSAPAEKQVN